MSEIEARIPNLVVTF